MRFQLPIVKCVHPNEARIRQLAIAPHCPGSVLAAVQGMLLALASEEWKAKNINLWQYESHIWIINRNILSGNNEVGLWNLESRYRQKVLWASSAPILSSSSSSPHSVSAIHPFRTINSQGHASTNILTAGTDMRIRYWDLDQPTNSEVISFGATESSDRIMITYK